eukprot:CAMPEP_0185329272 /NCGR_PEP_ID=MMETSP1363-20130426/74979_1 /TAXON_ID=38817 /ORGANISM="Gephyrocapsa oceanica, Strain RCC1303" /LENGTH=56 /DNA_ID=CAMNT_0027928085 /DNA_START=68 /DNA_END=235 /DNA_ORIENTATION=-
MSAAGDRAACLAASPGETRRRARRQAPGRRAGGGGATRRGSTGCPAARTERARRAR